jgi:hypothetical protein
MELHAYTKTISDLFSVKKNMLLLGFNGNTHGQRSKLKRFGMTLLQISRLMMMESVRECSKFCVSQYSPIHASRSGPQNGCSAAAA